MSVTAEDIMQRMSRATGGLTAAQIMERKAAADRALRVGTQSMGSPSGPERTFMERVQSGAAAVSEPWVRTLQGVEELMGADPETQADTAKALEFVQSQAKQSEGRTAGNVLGEVGMMALPAAKAYRGAQALTKGIPFLQRLAPITAESATVGGMEGLKTPEEGQTRLKQAMKAAAGNLVGGAVQGAVSRALRPQMFQRTPMAQREMAELREAGIKPDIPLALGSEAQGPTSNFVRWMQRQPLRAVPGFKKTLNRQVEQSLGDWREVMLRKALPEGADVPMPRTRTNEAPVDKTLEAIDDWYSQQYKEVLEPFRFDVVTPGSPVGSRINAALNDVPGEGVRDTIDQKLGDLLQKYGRAGAVSGENISALKTALRREAKLSQDGVAKQAYYDLLDAISEGVETQIKTTHPALGERYAALKGPYRNFITVDDAAGRVKFGEFTPDNLFSAGQRKATADKISRRKAPYREESQRAAEVYDIDPKERESNIFQLAALGGVTGFGGVAAPGLTAALWSPVLASMPRGGQKYLMGELPYQEALSKLLRKEGFQELSRAARIGGGQYLAE